MLGFCRRGSRWSLLAQYTPLALVDIRALIRDGVPVRAVEAVSVIAADRRYYAVISGAIPAGKASSEERAELRCARPRFALPGLGIFWRGPGKFELNM